MTDDELRIGREEALVAFKKDRAVMRQWMLAKDFHDALDAMRLAEQHHVGYRKDNVSQEAHHQIRISLMVRNLPDLMYRQECLVTAFTHDLIEDCDFKPSDIRNRFGPLVGDASVAMSKKIHGISRSEDEIFADMTRSPVASILKPIDRDDNLAKMRGVFEPAKRLDYAEFADRRILPMIKEARGEFHQQDAAYGILRYLISERVLYEREIAQLNGITG